MSDSGNVHFVPLTWEEVNTHTQILAQQLRDKAPAGGWKGMIAITRGGLVPAAILARDLDIRHIETVCIVSYNDMAQGQLRLLKGVDPEKVSDGGKDWLVIDDLVDSGSTAREIRRLLPQAYMAAIYAKPEGLPEVDHYIKEYPQNRWIIFPWEIPPKEANL